MKTASISKMVLFSILVIGLAGFIRLNQALIGKINFILGGKNDVTVLRAGASTWQNVRLYSAVYTGDQIKTNNESRCETKLEDQSIIRIGENTTFAFEGNQFNNNLNAEIKKGRFWANIRNLNIKNNFQVRTPTAVCAVRGTIYRIDADSSTKVMVYQGTVDVGPLWAVKSDTSTSQEQRILRQPFEVPGPTQVPGPFEVSLDQWIRIVAGFQIEVRPDGKYARSKIDKQLDSQDNWVMLNKQRDGLE